MSCPAWFDFVSLTGNEFPDDKRIDRIDCHLDAGHDGRHEARSPGDEGTVRWA